MTRQQNEHEGRSKAESMGATRPTGLPTIAPAPPVQDAGTITTPSFDLPFSSFASPEAKGSFIQRLRTPMPIVPDIVKTRQIIDERIVPQLALAQSLYPCTSRKSAIDGVPVETFMPAAGIAPENEDRVLIELHGGGFVAGGGGLGGAIESVPIAGTARIKIVAVDYRLGPEHRFPAASEDIERVYREVLKTYRPQNIGIYGSSAGGMLAAGMIAWFLERGLALPGALGILSASTHTFGDGDSSQLWPRMGSVIRIVPAAEPQETFPEGAPYHAGASTKDPRIVPSASKDVLKAFPPTLFLTGTRASEMSGAAQSHLELRELGVKSELLLFDGLDHCFFSDPALPESKRAYTLIARFFLENLGAHRKEN